MQEWLSHYVIAVAKVDNESIWWSSKIFAYSILHHAFHRLWESVGTPLNIAGVVRKLWRGKLE